MKGRLEPRYHLCSSYASTHVRNAELRSSLLGSATRSWVICLVWSSLFAPATRSLKSRLPTVAPINALCFGKLYINFEDLSRKIAVLERSSDHRQDELVQKQTDHRCQIDHTDY